MGLSCSGSCSKACSCAERAGALPRRLCGLRAWRWAAATLASRTMHLPGDAAGALAPFAELHNHRSPPGPELPAIGARLLAFQAGVRTKFADLHKRRVLRSNLYRGWRAGTVRRPQNCFFGSPWPQPPATLGVCMIGFGVCGC